MEYENVDDDLYPTPFFHRVSTWVVIVVIVAIVGFLGMRANALRTEKRIGALIERHQYDSAWSSIRSAHGLGDCRRYSLTANLLMLDEREDSLLVKMSDSLRTCSPDPDRLYELVARGDLRLATRAKGLDSTAQRKLYSRAYDAAMKCVHSDSLNRRCGADGFAALGGMKNPAGQLEWVNGALVVFPKDSAFLAMKAQALVADSLRKARATAETRPPSSL